jgi:hypothetical protein
MFSPIAFKPSTAFLYAISLKPLLAWLETTFIMSDLISGISPSLTLLLIIFNALNVYPYYSTASINAIAD